MYLFKCVKGVKSLLYILLCKTWFLQALIIIIISLVHERANSNTNERANSNTNERANSNTNEISNEN